MVDGDISRGYDRERPYRPAIQMVDVDAAMAPLCEVAQLGKAVTVATKPSGSTSQG